MKNILILGGCGFIGHNLALDLVEDKHKVTIVDSLQINNLYSLENNKDNLPNPELSKIIIEDRLSLLKNGRCKCFKCKYSNLSYNISKSSYVPVNINGLFSYISFKYGSYVSE